jgi:hypothetical protein
VVVYFKCKVCGKEHKSPIAYSNKNAFESSILVNNKFQCPNMRKIASYDKKDMLWKEDA